MERERGGEEDEQKEKKRGVEGKGGGGYGCYCCVSVCNAFVFVVWIMYRCRYYTLKILYNK